MRKKKYTPEQRNVIFVSVITSFITTFMGSALNLSVPDIEKDFGVSAATVGWVITIYMLTCAALAVPFGRIADMIKRKKILWMGILIFSIASAASMTASNMFMLLAFRAGQGIGASMIFSTNMAILVGAFDESRRGLALGYATCANYMGLSAGPVLGGVLNYNLGWKSVFGAAAAVSAVAFYVALKKLPDEKKQDRHKTSMDRKGNVFYVFSIIAMMYGLSEITRSKAGWLILTLGVISMIAFIKTEIKSDCPVIKVDMFIKNKAYAFSNIAALLNYGAVFSVSYLISIYLQVIMGYSSQIAGLLLIVSPVIMAGLSPVMGRLSDKHSPHVMSAIGMTICAAALFMFAFLPEEGSLAYTIAALSVSGLGSSVFSSPNTNAVMAAAKKEDYSVASSILATMRSIGHTTGMTVVTVIVAMYMGNSSLTEAEPQILMTTMHTCFFIFGGLCIIGIFMALRRKT